MSFARHEYSEKVMEVNRVKFYERFRKTRVGKWDDRDQPHLTYKPTYQ